MSKDFSTDAGSRLAKFAQNGTQGKAEIAGRRVSKLEKRLPKRKDLVKTSIKIPRELKEQSQALASLKQMSWIALIEKGLTNQLRANAKLMNQFTKYHIETDDSSDVNEAPSDGTDGTDGIDCTDGTSSIDK